MQYLNRKLLVSAAAACLLLGGCAELELAVHTAKSVTRQDAGSAPGTGAYKVGNSYFVQGLRYHPAENFNYAATGIASWYGKKFHGRATANGETFDMNLVSAAHKTLPMPSLVRVTNLENGRSLIVRVNDRGPFARGRIIDMSRRGAQLLGFAVKGTARVRVEIMARESRLMKARASKGLPTDAGLILATLRSRTDPRASAQGGGAKIQPDMGASVVRRAAAATSIFVQAGAFTRPENADRLRADLARFAPARIMPVEVDGRRLYRVRLGPIDDVKKGDMLLDRVVAAGHGGARLVVD